MAQGVDGFLTQKLKKLWPDAMVRWEDTGELTAKGQKVQRWWVARPGKDDLELGPFFNAAKLSVLALIEGEYKGDKDD